MDIKAIVIALADICSLPPAAFASCLADLPAHLRASVLLHIAWAQHEAVWSRIETEYAMRADTALRYEESYADVGRAVERARDARAQAERREVAAARSSSHADRAGHVNLEAVRRRLSDPREVASALGLAWRPAHAGACKVSCPRHDERTASCSLTVGRDGTLRARCFGCGWTGDVFGLVAAVLGLDARADFAAVARAAAAL